MRALLQVDAFTDRLFEGNPAAVVPDARGLDERTMLAIAREMNCSETAFVTPPTHPGATHKIRFFTPAREVPLCGHATVASFHVLATRGEAPREWPFDCVMECLAGDLPVRVDRDGGRVRVTMTQKKAAFAASALRGVVSQSVNLPPDALATKPVPELASSSGPWIAMLPVLTPDILAHCVPHAQKIRALGGTRAVDGIYVVALDAEAGPVARVRARFFGAEGLGIAEDPATGVAAGALAAWLAKLGRLAVGDELVVEQGIECGRPSTLFARADADGRPRVTGTAVTAFETTLEV